MAIKAKDAIELSSDTYAMAQALIAQANAENLQNDVNELSLALESAALHITSVSNLVDSLQDATEALNWEGYMKLYGLENNVPVVQLGDQDYIQNGYALILSNSQLQFVQIAENRLADTPIAFFGEVSDELFGLRAQNIETENAIIIGDWLFEKRSNRNLALKWAGGTV